MRSLRLTARGSKATGGLIHFIVVLVLGLAIAGPLGAPALADRAEAKVDRKSVV